MEDHGQDQTRHDQKVQNQVCRRVDSSETIWEYPRKSETRLSVLTGVVVFRCTLPNHAWPYLTKERLQARNAKRKVPKIYHTKCLKLDGSQGWSGGPHLATSAHYTAAFCKAILSSWLAQYSTENVQPEGPDGNGEEVAWKSLTPIGHPRLGNHAFEILWEVLLAASSDLWPAPHVFAIRWCSLCFDFHSNNRKIASKILVRDS